MSEEEHRACPGCSQSQSVKYSSLVIGPALDAVVSPLASLVEAPLECSHVKSLSGDGQGRWMVRSLDLTSVSKLYFESLVEHSIYKE